MARTAPLLAALLLACGCAHQPGPVFRDLRYPVETKLANVDGVEIAYADVGQGPRTLLLVHGLGSYLPVWSRNLPELAKSYRVVAIDLPGYGRSSKANYRYSMEFFARAVERFIETLSLEHVVLVGHSMGGQIALTHALLYPGRAEALVLVAPAGLERFTPGEAAWMERAVTKDTVKATAPEAVFANLAGNFSDMPAEARFMADDRTRIAGGPELDSYAYANARSVAAMLHGPVYERLGEIRVPSLVLFGTGDQLIPNPALHGGTTQSVAEEAKRIPGSQIQLIADAGHMVQFERPGAFDAAVLAFLSQMKSP